MTTLEYLIQVRGARVAAAEVGGLTGEVNKLAASQGRLAASGDKAAAGSAKAATAMGLLGKVARVGALGVAAIGFEAVKMSIGFNHEMLKIRTDAGASTKELANMKKGVLDLASSGASMGQGPMSLAQGLYHLESLNIRGARALHALKLASQEASISGANLEQTTTAMGAAMFTGIKGTGDLTHLMGILNATVGAGNMRFQQLNEALGTGLLPAAKVAGLGITDVAASLATLTDAGFPASSAAAQLGTALHFLYAPTSKATKALESIGLTSTSLALDLHKPRGLAVALGDLRTHLEGLSAVAKAQVLNAILPGGRGKVLLTELTMLDRLKGKYNQINKTAGGFTGSVAQQRHDPGTQLKMGEARIQSSLIGIGNVLTPIVLPALAKLLQVGAQVLDWLKNATTWLKNHKDAALALGIGIGVLVAGFVALKVATLAASLAFKMSPIGKVITLIALLAAGVVYAWGHFKTFRTIVTAVWHAVQAAAKFAWNNVLKPVFTAMVAGVKWLGGAFNWLWNNVVSPVWNAIKTIMVNYWTGELMPMFSAFKLAITALGAVFNWLWDNVVKPVWTAISSAITTAWGVISPILSALGSAFQTAFGIVLQVVTAVLSPIQTVTSAISAVSSAVGSLGSTSSSVTPSNITGNIGGRGGALGATAGGPTPAPAAPAAPSTLVGPGLIRPHLASLSLAHGAAFHVHVESPVYIDGREIARAHRRQVIKAMAAGA